MLDKKKVENFMFQSGLKKALIRKNGHYYFVSIRTDPGNQYSDPFEYASIEEIPPPIEVIDL